jgi:hypothetical protein
MWSDSEYRQNWRDLCRREYLFWLVVLSYVPGLSLLIIGANVFDDELPQHAGAYFSVAWLTGFVATGLYRQNFRCPRCHHLFFRRFGFIDPDGHNCLNCNLARGASGQ